MGTGATLQGRARVAAEAPDALVGACGEELDIGAALFAVSFVLGLGEREELFFGGPTT